MRTHLGKILDDLEQWRAAYRRSATSPSGSCLDDEAIVDLVTSDVGPDDRRELADHVVRCPSCADRWRIVRELHRQASAIRARRSKRSWLVLGAAAAAAAVLIIVGLGLFIRPPGSAPPASDVRGTASIHHGLEPPHGARLTEPPIRLVWSGDLLAPPYRIIVYDAESAPLWKSEPTSDNRIALPSELRERLSREGTYYWRVRTVEGPDSRASALTRFEIVAPRVEARRG